MLREPDTPLRSGTFCRLICPLKARQLEEEDDDVGLTIV
jgi:hypothetical protein